MPPEKKPKIPRGTKPYGQAGNNNLSAEPSSPSTEKTGPFTPAECLQLFDHVMNHGTGKAGLGNAVEGRTWRQCYDTWHKRILPRCRSALLSSK